MKIALLGAHTALAKAIIECAEERELEVELLSATTTAHIGPGLALIDEALLGQADALFLCFQDKITETIAARASALQKPVVDLMGLPARDAVTLWPGLLPVEPLKAGLYRIHAGLASPAVAALSALWPFSPGSASMSTYESAARFDQPGMDELSAQVQAMFGMRDPEHALFDASLAFNVLPFSEEAEDPEAPPTLGEAIREGLTALSGRTLEVGVQRALVPSFSAELASVQVVVEGEPDLDTVVGALSSAKGLKHSALQGAQDAVGRDDALVGRIQLSGDTQRRIGFWLACDRLRRGSATQAALLIETLCQAD